MMPPGRHRSTIRADLQPLSHPIVKMVTWKQGSPSPFINPVVGQVDDPPDDSRPDRPPAAPTVGRPISWTPGPGRSAWPALPVPAWCWPPADPTPEACPVGLTGIRPAATSRPATTSRQVRRR